MGKSLKTNRLWLREFFAEFIGTLFLVAAGDAAVAQMLVRANLPSPTGFNDFLSVGFAYGLAAAFALYISGGISGGHINPAVTFTMCLFGRLKWYKLPIYWIAQYLGAFVGAAILYFTYFDSITALNAAQEDKANPLIFVPGIFATYPGAYMNTFPALLDQIVGTAILLLVVFALIDERNSGVPKSFVPLLVGLVIGSVGMSFGIQCGFAINPARDLGPRLFTFIFHGAEVFWKGSKNFGYYFWIPIVGPHVGAILGAFIYQGLIGAHWPPPVSEVTQVQVEVQYRPPSAEVEVGVQPPLVAVELELLPSPVEVPVEDAVPAPPAEIPVPAVVPLPPPDEVPPITTKESTVTVEPALQPTSPSAVETEINLPEESYKGALQL